MDEEIQFTQRFVIKTDIEEPENIKKKNADLVCVQLKAPKETWFSDIKPYMLECKLKPIGFDFEEDGTIEALLKGKKTDCLFFIAYIKTLTNVTFET
jgi:hypothetical protein